MADKSEELFGNFEKEPKHRSKEEEFEVKIRFKKRWLVNIERGAYYAIILVLLYFVMVKPLVTECPFGKSAQQNTTSTVLAIETAPAVKEEAKKAVIPAVENKTKAEAPKAEVKKEEPIAPPAGGGNVTLSIGAIDMSIGEKLNTSDEANMRYKIESIMVSINNQLGNFQPQLKVYWYTASSPDVLKVKPRKDVNLTIIPLGVKPVRLDDEIPDYLSAEESDDKMFLKIELYNLKDMALMAKAEQTRALQ